MPEITVEDGSGVADANSYVTLDEQKAHLEAHPFGAATLALGDDVITLGIIQSFTVINSPVYKGEKVDWNQDGEFPRTGLDPIPSNVVPKQIKRGQMELCRFVLAGDRDTDADGAAVKREKLDVLEVEYQDGATRDPIPGVVRRMIAFLVVSFDGGDGGGVPSSSAVFVERA